MDLSLNCIGFRSEYYSLDVGSAATGNFSAKTGRCPLSEVLGFIFYAGLAKGVNTRHTLELAGRKKCRGDEVQSGSLRALR